MRTSSVVIVQEVCCKHNDCLYLLHASLQPADGHKMKYSHPLKTDTREAAYTTPLTVLRATK